MGGCFAENWNYCVKLLRRACSMASVGLEVSTTPSRICEGLQPLCPLTSPSFNPEMVLQTCIKTACACVSTPFTVVECPSAVS